MIRFQGNFINWRWLISILIERQVKYILKDLKYVMLYTNLAWKCSHLMRLYSFVLMLYIIQYSHCSLFHNVKLTGIFLTPELKTRHLDGVKNRNELHRIGEESVSQKNNNISWDELFTFASRSAVGAHRKLMRWPQISRRLLVPT
jgi:hypothetical protein